MTKIRDQIGPLIAGNSNALNPSLQECLLFTFRATYLKHYKYFH